MKDETPAQPADPFDLEALRSQPLDSALVERDLRTVPVRRPKRNEFFRVHPDPDYVIDAYTFEYENGLDREIYWVTAGMRGELLEHLQPTRLFTCVSKAGVTFLWPAKIPGASGAGRAWHVSALEIAEGAKECWSRMHGDRDLGAYVGFRAKAELPEPKWEDKSFRELIEIAFKDRIIDSPDHAVIRELNGLI